jgi:hypothetical protein
MIYDLKTLISTKYMIIMCANGIFSGEGGGSQFTRRGTKKICLKLIFESFKTIFISNKILIVIFVVVVGDLDIGGRMILKWCLEK